MPSFFVIGPPRTATSWIHDVLRPLSVLPSPSKETRFFDVHYHRGVDWYLAHFPGLGNGRQTGEIAPTYFASAEARERIAELIPDARIVCIFRNPVERVVSLYRVKRAYGMLPWSFEQAMVHDPELFESSRYGTYFKAWLDSFGSERVLPTIYDDLRNHPQSFMNTLTDFLDLPRVMLTPWQVRRVFSSETMTHPRSYYRTHGATAVAEWCKARRLDRLVLAVKESPLMRLFLGGGQAFNELSSEVANELYDRFRPEVEELESLLKRDFSTWKAPSAQPQTAQATAAS